MLRSLLTHLPAVPLVHYVAPVSTILPCGHPGAEVLVHNWVAVAHVVPHHSGREVNFVDARHGVVPHVCQDALLDNGRAAGLQLQGLQGRHSKARHSMARRKTHHCEGGV